MTKIPKGLRDQVVPGHDQRRHHQGEDRCETCDLLWHAVHSLRTGKEVVEKMGPTEAELGGLEEKRRNFGAEGNSPIKTIKSMNNGKCVLFLWRAWGHNGPIGMDQPVPRTMKREEDWEGETEVPSRSSLLPVVARSLQGGHWRSLQIRTIGFYAK